MISFPKIFSFTFYKSIKGIKSTYTFDKNYTFTFKNATILSNGNEMTLIDLSGTYELNMDEY